MNHGPVPACGPGFGTTGINYSLESISHEDHLVLQTDLPVYSPRISLDMMTVKSGAELFTVSAKDTATFFRLIRPRTTVVNLEDNAHTQRTAASKSVFGGTTRSCELRGRRAVVASSEDDYKAPHDSDEQHYHDEVGGILGPRLVVVEATRHEHLEAADDGGREHLNST